MESLSREKNKCKVTRITLAQVLRKEEEREEESTFVNRNNDPDDHEDDDDDDADEEVSHLTSTGEITFKRVPCIINHYEEGKGIKKTPVNKSLESPTATSYI